MSISFGVGSSSQADVFAAGQDAAREAISHLGGQVPDLTIVFSSVRFADPKMLKAVRSVTGAAPLIGCSESGSIITSGPRRRSVTVIGVSLSGGRCATAVERNISNNPTAAGESLAKSLQQNVSDLSGCMLLFPDGLTTSGSDLLVGVEKVRDRRVKVAGATAGDDQYFQKTFQYFNDEVLSDAVTGTLLSGSIKVGIGVRHGWSALGRPRKVTHAEGRIIYQLDKQPALSIYEDYLGLKRRELTDEPLALTTLSYPLGFTCEGQREYLLRNAIRSGRGGAIICTGNIPQGAKVRLMIGGYEAALEAAHEAAQDAREQLGTTPLKGGLVFSCVARQKMLGSEFQGEIDVIRDALGGAGVRIGGFYSYGEYASTMLNGGRKRQGPPLFHNESVVVVALG